MGPKATGAYERCRCLVCRSTSNTGPLDWTELYRGSALAAVLPVRAIHLHHNDLVSVEES